MRNKKPKKHSDILIGRFSEYITALDGLKEYKRIIILTVFKVRLVCRVCAILCGC